MQYEKYVKALELMDDTILICQSPEPSSEAIHEAWDKIYDFVFANFREPSSATIKKKWDKDTKKWTQERDIIDEDVEELMSMGEMFSLTREEIEEKLYSIPPVILEQCFPVWIARYLLCEQNVPVSPVKLETFLQFHKLYGYMVINCGDYVDAYRKCQRGVA